MVTVQPDNFCDRRHNLEIKEKNRTAPAAIGAVKVSGKCELRQVKITESPMSRVRYRYRGRSRSRNRFFRTVDSLYHQLPRQKPIAIAIAIPIPMITSRGSTTFSCVVRVGPCLGYCLQFRRRSEHGIGHQQQHDQQGVEIDGTKNRQERPRFTMSSYQSRCLPREPEAGENEAQGHPGR